MFSEVAKYQLNFVDTIFSVTVETIDYFQLKHLQQSASNKYEFKYCSHEMQFSTKQTEIINFKRGNYVPCFFLIIFNSVTSMNACTKGICNKRQWQFDMVLTCEGGQINLFFFSDRVRGYDIIIHRHTR